MFFVDVFWFIFKSLGCLIRELIVFLLLFRCSDVKFLIGYHSFGRFIQRGVVKSEPDVNSCVAARFVGLLLPNWKHRNFAIKLKLPLDTRTVARDIART